MSHGDYPSAYRDRVKQIVDMAVDIYKSGDARMRLDLEEHFRARAENELACLADSALDMVSDWLNPPDDLIHEVSKKLDKETTRVFKELLLERMIADIRFEFAKKVPLAEQLAVAGEVPPTAAELAKQLFPEAHREFGGA